MVHVMWLISDMIIVVYSVKLDGPGRHGSEIRRPAVHGQLHAGPTGMDVAIKLVPVDWLIS